MKSDTPQLINRASAYGDGLFETIAIRDGKPRLWAAHIARLQTDCERLGLQCPNADDLRELLDSELRVTSVNTDFASGRLVISAAASARGYRRNSAAKTNAEVTLFAAKPLGKDCAEFGVTTRVCDNRLAVQPALAGIKSLNRLEQVLARAEWDDADIFEGLMLDTDGRLICGTMSNVFLIRESSVVTPALTRCGVSGIMRAHVLSLLEEAGIGSEVRDVQAEELATATELFLSNSQFGILPVQRCDSHALNVGTVTRQVQALLASNGVPECTP